jgi:hypothetical protein
MGVSTSTMQFLRSVGGTMGVAILFSLIQSKYHSELASNVPDPVRARPELAKALDDPQFVLNPDAYQRVQQAFSAFGGEGQVLFAQTIEGVRASLATAIADAFLVAAFVLMVSLAVAFFMKEIPLRKGHYDAEETAAMAGPAAPTPAIPNIAGGAKGEDAAPSLDRA